MSVYILTCRDLGVAKVGFGRDPKRRAGMVATSCPAKTKLEAVIPATIANERQLHASLSDCRQRGEWFAINDKIEALIAAFPIGRARKRSSVIGLSSQIIDAFGGTTALARMIEAPPSTVHSWRRIGIPQSRMAHLRLLADASKIALPEREKAA